MISSIITSAGTTRNRGSVMHAHIHVKALSHDLLLIVIANHHRGNNIVII
jgi:hypothetical protein